MRRSLGALLGAAALAAVVGPAPASAADPDELMPCKIILVKNSGGFAGKTKIVCKGTFALPSAAAAPSGGGVVVDVNIVPPGTTPPTGVPVVPCVGLGNPAGSTGYKCKDPVTTSLALIKPNVVKVVIKDFDVPAVDYLTGHPYPSGTDVAIRVISYGATGSKQYCARFGGPPAIKDTATLYKRKDAPAPTACSPSGAFLDDGEIL
jgi:hypothetical protein